MLNKYLLLELYHFTFYKRKFISISPALTAEGYKTGALTLFRCILLIVWCLIKQAQYTFAFTFPAASSTHSSNDPSCEPPTISPVTARHDDVTIARNMQRDINSLTSQYRRTPVRCN
jgi:hypothetical protein